MVPQAIDEDLIRRIKQFVANDINRRIQSYVVDDATLQLEKLGDDRQYRVDENDIFILSFERVLNNWAATATASAETNASSFYKLVYDGTTQQILAHLFVKHTSFSAVL